MQSASAGLLPVQRVMVRVIEHGFLERKRDDCCLLELGLSARDRRSVAQLLDIEYVKVLDYHE